MRPIWVRREVYCWNWYEWDAWNRVLTDMTETQNRPLTLIWLRDLDPNSHRYDWDAQKNFIAIFILTQSLVCKIKVREDNFFERLRHICASLGRGISVISESTAGLASQSYRFKLCLKRLTHISFNKSTKRLIQKVRICKMYRQIVPRTRKLRFEWFFCV